MTARDRYSVHPDVARLSLRERKRLLDGGTVAILTTVFVAIAIPWFLRVLPIDLALATRAAFAYLVVYLGAAALTNRLRTVRALGVAVLALQGSAICFLGLLWHLAGGLQTPMFLAAFCLPVIASGIVLPRRAAYGAALWSVLVVGLLALAESSDLRWYLFQLGFAVDRIARFLPPLPQRSEPFPGLVGSPAYLFVIVFSFAIFEFGCAALATSLARALRHLTDRLTASRAADGEASGLLTATLRAASTPEVLIFSDTGQVVLASDSFLRAMVLHGEDLVGRDLFELIGFAESGTVRALLRAGGDMPFCRYIVGKEPRVTNLRVDPFCYGNAPYARVSFTDRTDLFYLQSAFQAIEEAIIVIGADDRLRYANPAAEALFGELYFGMDASTGLGSVDVAAASGQGYVEIEDTVYDLDTDSVSTAAESEVLRVLRLRPRPASALSAA